jgi:pre-rRNA-processing protein TSR4
MKEYLDFVQSDSYKKQSVEGGEELSVNDTLKEVDRDVKDKNYQKFRKQIQEEPEQVLRLQRGGEPLWVVSSCVPDEKNIPECSCGSRRIFEFQILPQMLYYLEVEKLGKERALDWGTLAVYTCERSCQQNGRQYMEEFIWKQDFN